MKKSDLPIHVDRSCGNLRLSDGAMLSLSELTRVAHAANIHDELVAMVATASCPFSEDGTPCGNCNWCEKTEKLLTKLAHPEPGKET